MKRMVYLFNSGYAPEEMGVMRKIISQCRAFEALGYHVSMHQLNKFKDSIIDYKNMSFSYSKGVSINGFNKLIYYHRSIKGLVKDIASQNPDIIYMRDALWSFDLYSSLSEIAPVFVEVQTNVMDELRILDKRRYYIEKLYGRSYFKYITGLICITREISQKELVYNKKPVFILGNGISAGDIKYQPREESDSRISLVFIGSPGESWHGIDRLIDSYFKSASMDKFKINIIGCGNSSDVKCDNITFHGYLRNYDSIGRIFRSSDIGIGTLALSRKKMNEAAPLKVRQYMAAGLPVIIGYDDTDLNENLPFVMKVPNDSSTVDFKSIEEFYSDTAEYRRNGTICSFAEKNLVWEEKIKKLALFMEENMKNKRVV